MNNTETLKLISAYADANWENMVSDIDALVRIPSFEELDKAQEGAPFGPGPRKALDAALKLACDMGFVTNDVDGYLGYADFPGASETQIGIIGHMDVVPAGDGWNFEPYRVTRKDGYLIGRGTIDDKGPSVVALYAMKFWKDQGKQLPYTIRFLFGANEESGMGDVAYYRERYADPAFLFTPDAEFPVCYGEKGAYDARITSKPIDEAMRVIVDIAGGAATNAVPGGAHAVVKGDISKLTGTDRIALYEGAPGLVRIEATGKSAHASMPDEGVNAIALLVNYLVEQGLYSADELEFLQFEQDFLNHTDGSGLGIATADEHFGPLTLVGGVIALEDDRFVQSLDCRYPTSITSDELESHLRSMVDNIGGTFENTLLMVPFLVDPNSQVIQALLDAYNEATGEDAQPFTQGGGTYAREFSSGASFGPEQPDMKDPDWVGMMHGPNEGASEELLKQAFCIYALTLGNLMQLNLD